LTSGSFGGSHVYADDGTYTVTVTVSDDDEGSDTESFLVTVSNVAPSLSVVPDQSTSEGALLTINDIGSFTDPGFANPLNSGGEVEETFTYSIDWGDGTGTSTGSATIDQAGSAGTPTAGSFDAAHVYADNGSYTVTVTVTDDDTGSDSESFQVIVANVAPTLWVIGNQVATAGEPLVLEDVGVFTDPGFANALNAGGEVDETFTYSIDWGDGTPPSTGSATIDQAGAPGTATAGSFDGSHTYASAGEYVVVVRVDDDDQGFEEAEFEVLVSDEVGFEFLSYQDEPGAALAESEADAPLATAAAILPDSGSSLQLLEAAAANAPPTLWVIGNQQIDEGPAFIADTGAFHDPDSSGTFSYQIDWGDGTPADTGTADIDVPGPPTDGSFDGEHAVTVR